MTDKTQADRLEKLRFHKIDSLNDLEANWYWWRPNPTDTARSIRVVCNDEYRDRRGEWHKDHSGEWGGPIPILEKLEQQQAALQLAEEALKAYADRKAWEDFVKDSYSGQCWQFDWDAARAEYPWGIAAKALTAINEAKNQS